MNCLESISRGVRCMSEYVRSCRSMTGGARRGDSKCIGCLAGSRMSLKGSITRFARWQFSTRPSFSGLNSISRTAIARTMALECWKHMLSASGRPNGQRHVIVRIDFHSSYFLATRDDHRDSFSFYIGVRAPRRARIFGSCHQYYPGLLLGCRNHRPLISARCQPPILRHGSP